MKQGRRADFSHRTEAMHAPVTANSNPRLPERPSYTSLRNACGRMTSQYLLLYACVKLSIFHRFLYTMLSIDSMRRHFHIPYFGSSSRGSSSSQYSGSPRYSAFPEDPYSAASPRGSSSSRRHRRHQSSSSSEKKSVTFASSRIDEEKLVDFCNQKYGNDYNCDLTDILSGHHR
ncbi:hypothetical protein F4678DRAFT_294737 [Xylaria arbuscula]|nr:hypothetical protein F4678DRAFT_294737 [Xylaria arbuscula]